MTLLTTALAVFAAWELLITLLPVHIPAWLQPALVAGFAVGATHLPAGVLEVAAVVGIVVVLHSFVAVSATATVVRRSRGSRLPNL
ncbi:hypothetical protein ACFYP4_02695 [Streptomyces sp. NPDC005551]|uniref:hypothetical protein n=1 Tax=Streptomyces sp. NPDC005551 TaxID=3364725 RepID=UPI003695B50F